MTADGGEYPADLLIGAGGARSTLRAAAANWPSPWREALTLALYNGTVFGTPIVHYEPKRLARGRAALAHLVMLSHPKEVADLIRTAIKATAG